MNFNTVFKKNFIKYDNVKDLYFELSNIVQLAVNTCHLFYGFCDKTGCFSFTRRNAHYANFAVYFLQTMV